MSEKPNEREVLIEFLELYQKFSCLWDITQKQYSNRDARNQALNVLKEKLNLIDGEATIDTVKKKIENMRASYKRERKKALQSKTTGTSPDKVFVPTLWYYDNLSFLDENNSVNRSGIDTFNTCDAEEVSENVAVGPPKRRRLTVAKKQERLLDAAQKMLSTPNNPAESYGLSTGNQLQEMSNIQRTIAEKLISEVIFYGKFGKLTIESNINLGQAASRSYIPLPSTSSSSFYCDNSGSSNSPEASTTLPNVMNCSEQNEGNEAEVSTFGTSAYSLQDYIVDFI